MGRCRNNQAACPSLIYHMLVLLFAHGTPENRTQIHPMGNSSGGRAASLRSWESHPSAVLAEPSFDGSIIISFSTSSPPPGAAPAFVMDFYRSETEEKQLEKPNGLFPLPHGESHAGSLEKSRIRTCLMKCVFGCQSTLPPSRLNVCAAAYGEAVSAPL